MAEEFQGGVCSSPWWNPSLFSGGNGLLSPCSVTQLGGATYDIGSFGWHNEIMKSKSNNNQVCDDNNNLVFSADFDSTLDILGFGLSPTSSTTDWNQQNHFCKGGSNEETHNSMLFQDNWSSSNVQTMINSSIFPSQDRSPPTTMSSSSNSSGDSSTIITREGGLTTNFPMNPSASYLIQTLFEDDVDESQVSQPQPMSNLTNPNNYGSINSQVSNFTWDKSSANNDITSLIQPTLPQPIQLLQRDKFNGGMNMLDNCGQVPNGDYSTATTLRNMRASLLNSLQSRCRAPTLNQKSHKLKQEEFRHETKKNMNNNNDDQPIAKRPRIDTPSSLPTFKVRKEKLGDRITALQQLVSPFGKTDTASVLQEAIEYIKFLHDQVHGLSTPYLKKGADGQHQQVSNDNGEPNKQDLQSRGLCLVPISSTYPVTQETPVDFWTPTFGGTTFR